MRPTAIDWARTAVLARNPDELTPSAVLFLLRECVRVDDEALRRAVEHGLTRGLGVVATEPDAVLRMEWLRLLAEASAVSDDERLSDETRRTLPASVDLLEHHVRRSYEPGEGLSGAGCVAEMRCASALLAAFDLTGRLPYAMLAEELLAHARRQWWDAASASFEEFGATCVGLRVSCRLAALHDDPGYAASAVVVPRAGYRVDASRTSAAIAARATEFPADAADAGLALLEWFALESNLQ